MSPRPAQVSISGGKGVVVGDYATVFQTFVDGSRPLSAAIRTRQFQTLVDDRTKDFVGRDFIFDGVARVLQGDEYESGYVLILGEPGIGKTAVAARLVLRLGCVHHFNIAAENICSPRQFLENTCAQLITRYELDHTMLPADAGNDAGFLEGLLREVADCARERGELPVVVVVDAIDEADDRELAPSANRLFLPRVLPPGVFFVLTGREESDDRLNVDHATTLWIRDDDPANTADVKRYVEAFIARHAEMMTARTEAWGLDVDEFVDELVSLSEGNFMYLVHVLPEILRGRFSRETIGDIDALPRGLVGYYRQHWRGMQQADQERFERLQRPVLCLLAVSLEPVTAQEVADWAGLQVREVRKVIAEWREFLNTDDAAKPLRYRIYHRSFAEFLDQEEGLLQYHRQITSAALAKIPGF